MTLANNSDKRIRDFSNHSLKVLSGQPQNSGGVGDSENSKVAPGSPKNHHSVDSLNTERLSRKARQKAKRKAKRNGTYQKTAPNRKPRLPRVYAVGDELAIDLRGLEDWEVESLVTVFESQLSKEVV